MFGERLEVLTIDQVNTFGSHIAELYSEVSEIE